MKVVVQVVEKIISEALLLDGHSQTSQTIGDWRLTTPTRDAA